MYKNRDCPQYLGVYISEQVLSKVFKNVTRMPNNNPGYDFICSKGYKIDVKSACAHYNRLGKPSWQFTINKNKIADYFLLLAFDELESLQPQRMLLIPGNEVNDRSSIVISDSYLSAKLWSKYEQPIDKVMECCNILREAE